MSEIDSSLCEELVEKGARGDVTACQALTEYLHPLWLKWIRANRSMGPLASSEDHVRNVALSLREKVVRAKGRGLSLYLPWRDIHRNKTFEDWIRIVTKNAVRDYVRKESGYGSRGAGEPSQKRLLNEFSTSAGLDRLGVRPRMTDMQTARQLLQYAEKALPADQLRALSLWLEGAAFEEIDQNMALERGGAEKLKKAAAETLRRHFRAACPQDD